MVRLTQEVIEGAYQYINAVNMREISLRGMDIAVLENLGATRDFFDTIDLTDNFIRKLENLPVLKRLNTLIMHNNHVMFIQDDIGAQVPNLQTLVLTHNSLNQLGDIDSLATCKKLEYLTLTGNPLTHNVDYRHYVIHKIPSVRVLDYKRVKDAEREEARKKFKGKKGAQLRKQLGQKTEHLTEKEEVQSKLKFLSAEDKKAVEEAIKNAKTLAEVNELTAKLMVGQIPNATQDAEPMVTE
ncbi:hypothetical protein QR680_004421 [Steinernema hermaphroditum]|uniref:Probable U2 small nuclear ribonucleoprotein A' n=1 Tax=Steinernema hermaphroditum TaxID=289476 RepID=A0AA39HPP3_9BILA|nr:hypothetical protein QR680_004421 [Steinernema hermaphroditum]